MKREVDERLQKLWDEGKKVFSFSKLNCFNNCEYEYFCTYILNKPRKQNIYGELGGFIHDQIEMLYKGETTKEDIIKAYETKMVEIELSDNLNFANEKIENGWRADIEHFLHNFEKIDKKAILEKFVLFEPVKDIYIQGYVDAIFPTENKKLEIIDWKTSSKFTGKKIKEAGRQLVLYKMALESTTDYKVERVGWYMIKYLNVCTMLKNGKVKKSMRSRRKWVEESRNVIEKELDSLGVDLFEMEMLMEKAIKDKNLDCMPKQLKNKIWLEDCIVYYDVTKEEEDELRKYIEKTVTSIDLKDNNNPDDWKPIEITKYNNFFCGQLCSHSKTCVHYRKFVEENKDDFKPKKEKKDEFDIFA